MTKIVKRHVVQMKIIWVNGFNVPSLRQLKNCVCVCGGGGGGGGGITLLNKVDSHDMTVDKVIWYILPLKGRVHKRENSPSLQYRRLNLDAMVQVG